MIRRSVFYENYPRYVSMFTEKFLEVLEKEHFFSDEDVDYDITFKRFADLNLSKWINGKDLSDFNEEEFSENLNFSIIETDLLSLKEKGFLDSIDDEYGESHFFLTDKGKKYTEALLYN